jgi:hypothetical protein
MGKIAQMNGPYDKNRTLQRIKKLLLEGEVQILFHAQEKMRVRRLDMLDVQHVLRYGMITEITSVGERWRYRIEGKTVDGRRAGCVVEINGRMLVVTVFEIGRWTR